MPTLSDKFWFISNTCGMATTKNKTKRMVVADASRISWVGVQFRHPALLIFEFGKYGFVDLGSNAD